MTYNTRDYEFTRTEIGDEFTTPEGDWEFVAVVPGVPGVWVGYEDGSDDPWASDPIDPSIVWARRKEHPATLTIDRLSEEESSVAEQ